MYKMSPGPSVYVDVDDTLIMWSKPENYREEDLIEITCRGVTDKYVVNRHNLHHLIKMGSRAHAIVVWSAGGSDWAEAVVKALDIGKYVEAILTKPAYYIDDVKDTSRFMGKYAYYDYDGKRHGYAPKEEEDESK